MIDLSPFAYGGYLLKTAAGVHVVVRPMMSLYRLLEVPEESPRDQWRFWCYATFEAAVLAGAAWDPSPGTAPVGWVRSGGARQ